MPPLKGYESQATRSTPQGQSLQAPTTQLAQQQSNTLASRLDQFSSTMLRAHEAKVSDQAVNDALKDSAEGKPFHKEEVYTTYGRAYNNTLSATYAADAELQLSKKSLELAIEHEYNPVGYSDAMDSFTKSLSENAPTPELSTVIGLSGQKTKNSTFGKLTVAENERFKAKKIETFNQAWDHVKNQIVELRAQGKHADADVVKAANLTYLDAMVEEGLIDESEKIALISDAAYDVTYGTDVRLMEQHLGKASLQDAVDFLQSKTAENRTDMSIPQNDQYRAALTNMLYKENKRRDANSKAEADFSTQVLKSWLETTSKGHKSVYSTSEIENAMSKSSSKQVKFDVMMQLELNKKVPNWRSMSITEMEDVAAGLRLKELNPAEAELLKQMDKEIAHKESMIKNDVVGLAIEEGVIDAPQYGMSAQDGVGSLIEGLNNINTFAIQGQYGNNATNLLTKQDATSWKNYFEAPGNTDEKINTIQAIADLSTDKAQAFYNQIAGKDAPTFGFVANLTIAGNKEAAAIALKGKNSGVKIDKPEDFKKNVDALLSNVWAHDESGTILNRDSAGIINYNRGTVANGGDQLDASDAVEATFGTVADYNGKDVIIPRGVDPDDFDDWIENQHVFINNSLADELKDMNSYFGDKTVQIHQAGNGKYKVYKLNNGKGFYVEGNEPGKPLILDYYKKAF